MMDSWVRYSVAVYFGLLMAGSIIMPAPSASIGAQEGVRLDPYLLPAEVGLLLHQELMPVPEGAPRDQAGAPACCPGR